MDAESNRLTQELEKLRTTLIALQIRCGFCICEGSTDECCPSCIPGVPADIFQRYEAAVKLIEKVRHIGNSSTFVSVFSIAQMHHAGYTGETWKQELNDFDRACGRPAPPETATTLGTSNP